MEREHGHQVRLPTVSDERQIRSNTEHANTQHALACESGQHQDGREPAEGLRVNEHEKGVRLLKRTAAPPLGRCAGAGPTLNQRERPNTARRIASTCCSLCRTIAAVASSPMGVGSMAASR